MARSRSTDVSRTCEGCGHDFMAARFNVERGWGRFCSQRCRTGRLSSNWKGGPEQRNGYQHLSVDGRPRLVHITVAEQALGRRLPSGAQVHHVNGVKTDNRNSNLVICQDNAYHRLLHWLDSIRKRGGRPFLDAFCSDCKSVKQMSEFHTRKTPSGGRMPISTCKQCVHAQAARRRAA